MKILLALLANLVLVTTLFAAGPAAMAPQLRSNLYIVDPGSGEPVLMDGTLSIFDDKYSNDVDRYDARKMFNPGENWGMVRGSDVLIVERKQNIQSSDTIFFKMWNLRIITYRLEFLSKYFQDLGIEATLIDNYLHNSTAISLTSDNHVDFKVNSDAGSRTSDRFMLVFSRLTFRAALPLSFINTNASLQNGGVTIKWTTGNEKNVKNYTVEHSTDGFIFASIGNAINANNLSSGEYNSFDASPASGVNYYRINAMDLDGKTTFSDVMKVTAMNVQTVLSMYPNPATASNINLKISGQQQGDYSITVMTSFGNIVHRQTERLSTSGQLIKVSPTQRLLKGVYRVEISGPNGYRNTISLLINN